MTGRRDYVEVGDDGTVRPVTPLPKAVQQRAAEDPVWAEIAGLPPVVPMTRDRRRKADRIVKRAVRKAKKQMGI